MRAIPTVRERARTLQRGGRRYELLLPRRRSSTRRRKKKFLTPESAPRLAGLRDAARCRSTTWDERRSRRRSTAGSTSAGSTSRTSLSRRASRSPGARSSPGLYEVLAVLGKTRASSRLDRGVELAERAERPCSSRLLQPSVFPPRRRRLAAAPGFWASLPAGRATCAAFVPIPVIVARSLPLVWLFFRDTWRELDDRGAALPRHAARRRAATICGRASLFVDRGHHPDAAGVLRRPRDLRRDRSGRGCSTTRRSTTTRGIKLAKYDELYGYAWWAFTRIAATCCSRSPSTSSSSARTACSTWGCASRGFLRARLDLRRSASRSSCPAMWLVSRQPDFGTYYPFYKAARAAGSTFSLWEGDVLLRSSSRSSSFSAACGSARCDTRSARAPSSRWRCPTA